MSYGMLRVALLVCTACVWSAAGQKPLQLTDSTFEVATQASTGQTTGHWYVLFDCPEKTGKENINKFRKLWADLAEETWRENSGFRVAEVNTCENGLLMERFDANSTSLILFRDRKMYKYPLVSSQNWPTQTETLQQFATAGYQQAEALQVPAPKGLVAVYWNILLANMKELHALGFVPIAALVVGFIVIKFAVFLYLNERKVSKATTVQKKQS